MYDVIIIGGGPAGLTAGIYSSRARLNVVLLVRFAPGGQVLTTDWVENYPGFPEGISGFELTDRMRKQAERFGLVIQNKEVTGVDVRDSYKVVLLRDEELPTKTIIIATGATPKKIGIPGEDRFTGKGVSYCATCDGPFYRDQEVVVIGGGDTALEESLFLTRFVNRVYLVHRRDQLRAIKLLQERVFEDPKIELVLDTIPLSIEGGETVEGIELKNVKTGKTFFKKAQGVFIFIGTQPNTDIFKDKLRIDEQGFIITDNKMQTSIPGIFAAGDVRSKPLRQISTAVGEGASAAFSAEKFLESLK